MFTRNASGAYTKRAATDPLQGFSLTRLLLTAADPHGRPDTTPEYRLCKSLMQNRTDRGLGESGVSVPLGIFQRDLVVGTGSAGGYTVGAPVVAHGASLIGADITDLVTTISLDRGEPSVPIVDTPLSHTWLTSEGGAITPDGGTFGSKPLTHCALGVMLRFTTQLARGGGQAFENLIRGELERAIKRAVSAAILNGSGTDGEPTGLANTAGVLTASGTALSYSGILDLVRQVLATGAKFSDLAIIVGTTTYQLLAGRRLEEGGGSTVLSAAQAGAGLHIGGIPVVVSEQAPVDSFFLGPWRECVLATWGGIDLLVDRRSAVYGNVQVSGFIDLAIAFRRPGSFAVVEDVT